MKIEIKRANSYKYREIEDHNILSVLK